MHTITVYQSDDGKWRWRRQAGNNRIVAASEQGFSRRKTAVKDAEHEVPATVGRDYRLVILP